MGVEKKEDDPNSILEESNNEQENQMEEIEYSQPIEQFSPSHQDPSEYNDNDQISDNEQQNEQSHHHSPHHPNDDKVLHPELKSSQLFSPYEIGEHVDCLDQVGKWCNAEIVSKRGTLVKVHFTGWSSKYDEWIDVFSHRILTQWKRGQQLRLNNRIDVKDQKGKWLEAIVIDIFPDQQQQMKIHYKGWSSKFDEIIPLSEDLLDQKYAEIGMYSSAYGQAKFNQQRSKIRYSTDLNHDGIKDKSEEEIEEIKKRIQEIKDQENKFRRVLAMKGMKIKEMEGDGNCLFRAISDQVYNGDQEHYDLIRHACLDYIESERDFFVQFIIGGEQAFDQYVERKRLDGVWGDDIELQAMSEIYNRPIEIYAYRAEPLRTFHEEQHRGTRPIKLSYHGNEHYNSIIDIKNNKEEEKNDKHINQALAPGYYEEQALKQSRLRKQASQGSKKEEFGHFGQSQPLQFTQINTEQNKINDLNDLILRSRHEFEQNGKRDMEVALLESLQIYEKEIQDQENNLLQNSTNQYEEEQIMQMALKESIQDKTQQQLQWESYSNSDEEMLRKAIEMSKDERQSSPSQMNQANKDQSYEDVINLAFEYGFDAEQAVEAISIIGNTNPDMVINYLLSLQQP